jgi:hypothetical protein
MPQSGARANPYLLVWSCLGGARAGRGRRRRIGVQDDKALLVHAAAETSHQLRHYPFDLGDDVLRKVATVHPEQEESLARVLAAAVAGARAASAALRTGSVCRNDRNQKEITAPERLLATFALSCLISIVGLRFGSVRRARSGPAHASAKRYPDARACTYRARKPDRSTSCTSP